MKCYSLKVLTSALVALPLIAFSQIIDADFEAATGDDWAQDSGFGTGTFAFSFPASGGNPGGYGLIDSTAVTGGFAVLVANSGNAISLADLGLTAGESYLFSQDMKIFAGPNIGGFKVDFFFGDNTGTPDAATPEIYPAVIGDGSTWETYQFEISIPDDTTTIKVVPLWAPESSVGFDNIEFSTTPIIAQDITEIPDGAFDQGGSLWTEFGFEHTAFSYPASGGNPGRHAVMTNDGIVADDGLDFGGLVSNGGGVIPIAGLGLTAGETYIFQQDMKLLSGSNLGGLKVEFYQGSRIGESGDLRVPLIGDGSTWETYRFEIAIPLNTTGIKVIPLWGPESSVAYDNVSYLSEPILSTPVRNPGFESGGLSWPNFSEPNSDPNGPQLSSYEFPESGGNPDGYAQIENTEGWGVIVANDASFIPIEKFGITEEGTYEFKMDMKIFGGSSIGGLKVEYEFSDDSLGDTGDIYPATIGDGSTWETYTFDIFIPDSVTGLKVVALAGFASTVGYDNIVTPTALDAGFAGWISTFPGVGTLSGFDDDPDGDGQPNGVENFFGTDPSVSTGGLTTTAFTSSSVDSVLRFVHPQNANPVPEAAGAVYQWTTDLETYYADGDPDPAGTTVSLEPTLDDPSVGTTSVEAVITGPRPRKIFVRVVIPAP